MIAIPHHKAEFAQFEHPDFDIKEMQPVKAFGIDDLPPTKFIKAMAAVRALRDSRSWSPHKPWAMLEINNLDDHFDGIANLYLIGLARLVTITHRPTGAVHYAARLSGQLAALAA